MSRRQRARPDPVELSIDDLSHDGRGVAHVDGKAVFVPDALPGERVLAQPFSRRAKYDQANLVEVLNPSPQRIEPRCDHFGDCGACALQHLDSADQLAMKARVLAENFERIGKVEPEQTIAPLAGQAWGYRRKARLSVKLVPGKGRVLVGFRERNPRFVANLRQCEVLHPAVGHRLDALSELIGSLSIVTRVPQVEVAAGDDQVALVLRHLDPFGDGDRDKLIAFARETGLAVLAQSGGPQTVVPVWPETVKLSYRLPRYALELRFEPLDFFQVNADLNQAMIDQALHWLAPEPEHRALDLFCGLGNFSLPLARHCAEVIGVEGEGELVARAADNARRNDINNAHFHSADLREPAAEEWRTGDFQRVLLDPPRSGAEACLDWLADLGPERMVYVSCHPGSLARDAGILVHRHGFTLKAAGVMDMFPHTAHVESMAVFTRD